MGSVAALAVMGNYMGNKREDRDLLHIHDSVLL